jgi:hypothetical protein
MIEITNVEIFGWKAAIRGMRNPMNSWNKSDSLFLPGAKESIGDADKELMMKLSMQGPVHSKYLRMINVTIDINAPLYWWKEFDTYKVGTITNSCSTMHKIHSKKFELSDFSVEHLNQLSKFHLEELITRMNRCREMYLKDKDKDWWWQLIQLLPSSYNQRRTVQLNYAVLQNIYEHRLYHKLDEWREFCRWIESLPHSELITRSVNNNV